MSTAFVPRWRTRAAPVDSGHSPGGNPTSPNKPPDPPYSGFSGSIPGSVPNLEAPPAAPLAPVLPGPWPACSGCGRASGWRSSAADPTLRCPCGTPREEPGVDGRCVRCRAELPDPGDLLCPSCYCAATAPKVARSPAVPVEIERGAPAPPPRRPATATDGVRVPAPAATEAQLELLPGEAP